MVSAALVGAVVSGVFAVMEYGLQYHEGKITRAQLFDLVWKQVSVQTAVGVCIAGVIAGLAILFPPLMAVLSAIVLPLAFVSFAFVGYQFYAASKSWREAGFDPLLGAWDTSKAITREGWERSASLFEKFQDVAGSALQRVLNWLGVGSSTVEFGDLFPPVEVCDYSLVETYDYWPVEICDQPEGTPE